MEIGTMLIGKYKLENTLQEIKTRKYKSENTTRKMQIVKLKSVKVQTGRF